jgi:hypothetical protein
MPCSMYKGTNIFKDPDVSISTELQDVTSYGCPNILEETSVKIIDSKYEI